MALLTFAGQVTQFAESLNAVQSVHIMKGTVNEDPHSSCLIRTDSRSLHQRRGRTCSSSQRLMIGASKLCTDGQASERLATASKATDDRLGAGHKPRRPSG